MQKHTTLKIWELSALIGLSLCLLAGTWSEARLSSISAGLVRLHVLAASDAPEEQAVKLRVRDAVLETLSPLLEEVGSADEAEAVLLAALPELRAAAERAAGGRPVAVSLDEERYPTRDYGGFRLPAGRYRSLRVVLGEGKGHNWWCVVFPPVCLSAVRAEALRPTMNSADYALLTGAEGWELRFRTVELWGELMAQLAERGLLSG
jgi:stage II sporulation protein R